MKQVYVALAAMLLFAACRKNIDQSLPQHASSELASAKSPLQTCDFGIQQFNTAKRANVQGLETGRKGPTAPPPPPPPPSPATPVIMIDFDGQTVSNTSWNTNGNIVCSPANLTADQMNEIVARVTEDYRPFNVTITTDESVYTAGDPMKRMRVIVTESWEWYGQTGGVSYVNSFTWGDNTPCFVFSVLLNYNTKQIAEAVSHEAGHTLGLYHQSVYDNNCNLVTQYNAGTGSGETGWAPIMGCGYYENLSTWHNGTNVIGCTVLQDDVAKICGVLGFKTDDYPNTIANAPLISQSVDGVITKDDIDFFKINITATSVVSAIPFSVGSNQGADIDILMKIYNANGTIVSTINDPTILSASTSLPAGQYYVSVEPTGNSYSSGYGVMGKYTLSIQ